MAMAGRLAVGLALGATLGEESASRSVWVHD